MLEKSPPNAAKLVDRLLVVGRHGIVPRLRHAYDDCVETKLPVRLQRLLDMLAEDSTAS
jgi:hypothetical protein